MQKKSAIFGFLLLLMYCSSLLLPTIMKEEWTIQMHDFKNHVICINDYIYRADFDGLANYMGEMSDTYPKTSGYQIISDNIIVDALLNNKILQANQNGSVIQNDLEIPSTLAIENSDLCIILGNALDNAIEAVKSLQDKRRRIHLLMKYIQGNLLIQIKNPYIEKKKKRNFTLTTTKENILLHGFGLKSIEKSVRKYDGSIDIDKQRGVFTISILLYCHDI